ncbi:MAG: hypothetical protein K2J65_08595 [Duncaniella sp.]|nr:hypothetical protein [Duncaniella sp.]
MNQNQKDVISERSMLAVCIVVGLILLYINPFIVIALWFIWLFIHKHNRLTSLNQGI